MRLFGKIATVLLLMVYIAAFVGFRLHECAVDHTVEVLSVLADDACEEVHHHHCHDEARCGHHHHHCHKDSVDIPEDGGAQIAEACCCVNSLYFISDAQLVPDGGVDFAPAKCLPAAYAPVPSFISHLPGSSLSTSYLGPCRSLKEGAVLALYSVRRV